VGHIAAFQLLAQLAQVYPRRAPASRISIFVRCFLRAEIADADECADGQGYSVASAREFFVSFVVPLPRPPSVLVPCSLFIVLSSSPPTFHFCILRFDFCVPTAPNWSTSASCFSPPFCYTYPQSFRRGTDLCRRRPFLVTSHVLACGSRAVRCSGGLRDRSEMIAPPRAVRSEFGNRPGHDFPRVRLVPNFPPASSPTAANACRRCSMFIVHRSALITSALVPGPEIRTYPHRLGRGQSALELKGTELKPPAHDATRLPTFAFCVLPFAFVFFPFLCGETLGHCPVSRSACGPLRVKFSFGSESSRSLAQS